MPMTPEQRTAYEKFLARLRETPRDWVLDHDGRMIRLRTDGFLCCPLSVFHPAGPQWPREYLAAARALEIDKDLAHTIAHAADIAEGYDPAIRADLLAACGLRHE
jgi:hypothetical protein